jgi:hypothetical protein
VEHSHDGLFRVFPQNLPEELKKITKHLARISDLALEI